NKKRIDLISKISLFCWISSCSCTSLVEIGKLRRLSTSMKKLEKDLKGIDKHENDQYQAKVHKYNNRSLALVKAALDIVVAAGLHQLAPKKIIPVS
ncbi:Peroxisomal membrane protein 11C, partial [Bienertia sinuspersici]